MASSPAATIRVFTTAKAARRRSGREPGGPNGVTRPQPAPLHVERVRIVNAERDALAQSGRERSPCLAHAFAVRIEGIHLPRPASGEPRQPPFTAADLQHSHALEVRDFGDRGRLDALGIANLHPEDDTAIWAWAKRSR